MQALNAALPADYVATVEVRCVISHSAREIEPDVPIVESRRITLPRSTGGAAVLERPETVTPSASDAFDLPLVVSVEPLEERQAFVNVMRVGGGKFRDAELVTSLEILSPTNKTMRDDRYKIYRRK